MKTLLLAVFAVLVAFSAYMVGTRPVPTGKAPIVWVTDKNPLRDEQIAGFKKAHPDLDLVIDPGNTDTQKVIVQSQAGVGPDVFDYWGWASLDAYVRSGIAWDITDELKKRGIRPERDIWPLALPWIMTPEGRVYGIPANVGTDAIWFHKDLFDAAKVPYPKDGWTLEEFVRVAQALTKRDAKGKVTQFGFLVDFGACYRELLPSFGGDIFDESGVNPTVDQPASVASLTFARDLIYKWKVSPTPNDEQSLATGGGWGGGAGPQAYFRRKIGAMALGGRWWLAQLRDDIKTDGFRLGAVPPPIAKLPRYGNGGTRAVMINSRSPRREQALDFLLYLAGPTYNRLLNEQADALSGFRKYAYEPGFDRNPRDPGQDFHAAFRTTLERGVQLRVSPFVSASEVDLYLNRQLDFVKIGQKEPQDALRDAARDIRDAMRRNVERSDAALQARFRAAGGVL